MTIFKHNFDLGSFILYKNLENGKALFYEIDELKIETNPIKEENRLIEYNWSAMREEAQDE